MRSVWEKKYCRDATAAAKLSFFEASLQGKEDVVGLCDFCHFFVPFLELGLIGQGDGDLDDTLIVFGGSTNHPQVAEPGVVDSERLLLALRRFGCLRLRWTHIDNIKLNNQLINCYGK
jgi:hypothetical protein